MTNMDGEKYEKEFTTRTVVIWDRGIQPLHCVNQYEAIGVLRRWLKPDRIRKIMHEIYFADIVKKGRIPTPGSIRITDKGEVFTEGFFDPYEAIGFVSIHLSGEIMNKTIGHLLNVELPKFELMKCHMILHDGGEVEPRDFNSAYQAIGFMNVMCSDTYLQVMEEYVSKLPPTKFEETLDVDVDAFIEDIMGEIFGGDDE